MFIEYFGLARPVDAETFVQTIDLRRRRSKWRPAWFVDWKHIGDDTDVIGYRVAGPIRTRIIRLQSFLASN